MSAEMRLLAFRMMLLATIKCDFQPFEWEDKCVGKAKHSSLTQTTRDEALEVRNFSWLCELCDRKF
jgi:hypothetical protein